MWSIHYSWLNDKTEMKWGRESWRSAHTFQHFTPRNTRCCRSTAYSDYIHIWMGMRWTCEERFSRKRKTFGGMGWNFCPFFVKLFEYIPSSPFHYLPWRFSFFYCREKHRTMDRFCLLVFFAPRFFCWPFGGNIDFRFLRQPSRKPPSRFCRREAKKKIRKRRKTKDEVDAEWTFDFSICLSLLRSCSSFFARKLSRTWDATSFL